MKQLKMQVHGIKFYLLNREKQGSLKRISYNFSFHEMFWISWKIFLSRPLVFSMSLTSSLSLMRQRICVLRSLTWSNFSSIILESPWRLQDFSLYTEVILRRAAYRLNGRLLRDRCLKKVWWKYFLENNKGNKKQPCWNKPVHTLGDVSRQAIFSEVIRPDRKCPTVTVRDDQSFMVKNCQNPERYEVKEPREEHALDVRHELSLPHQTIQPCRFLQSLKCRL